MKNFYIDKTAVIDEPVKIGDGTKIWHWVHIMAGARIGKNCVIGQNVFVGGKAIIGNNVHVQNNVSIYDGVILSDDVFCGPSAVFTNIINPRSAVNRKDEFIETRVEKGASIGANVTIICGNNIGEFALIGAGSVVTKSVPNYALVVGNPAKQIGWISKNGIRLEFDLQKKAYCSSSDTHYIIKDNECIAL